MCLVREEPGAGRPAKTAQKPRKVINSRFPDCRRPRPPDPTGSTVNAPVGVRLEITWVCACGASRTCHVARLPDPAVSAWIRVLPRSRGTAPGQLPPAGPRHPAVAAGFYPLPVPGQGAARVPAAPSPSQEGLPNTSRIPAPTIGGILIHNDDRSPCAGLLGRETSPVLRPSGRHQTTSGTCDTPETHLTLERSREPAQRTIVPVRVGRPEGQPGSGCEPSGPEAGEVTAQEAMRQPLWPGILHQAQIHHRRPASGITVKGVWVNAGQREMAEREPHDLAQLPSGYLAGIALRVTRHLLASAADLARRLRSRLAGG
jgi:hypothetical protein